MTQQPRWPIRLGGTQWLIISLALCLIALLGLWALLHPSYYEYDCEHRYLPSVQAKFGFKGGRATLTQGQREPYALLEVTPAGPLGQAGFVSGDVPAYHHGGLMDFCGAIQYSEQGGSPEITVTNIRDYNASRARRLRVPPLPTAP